jgi:hypothetical protein
MPRHKEIIKKGTMFGGVKYIHDVGMIGAYRTAEFKCFCGNVFVSKVTNVKKSVTRSCGCLRNGRKGEMAGNYKHGLSSSRLYGIWNGMKHRCYNVSDINYKRYGGRGISVCNEWVNNFLAFYKYASTLDNHNNKNYSIDRIDNDGDYEPGNIRFATQLEQCENRKPKKAYSNTGRQGVYERNGKFFSSVTHNGKLIHMGTFKTIDEAVVARRLYVLKNKIKNRIVA